MSEQHTVKERPAATQGGRSKEGKVGQAKMGLLSCILMGIGSIIGASIFATTPIAIKIVGGNGVVLGFVFASVFVFLKTIPEIVLSSALPANGAAYMHLSRLIHPVVGALFSFNQIVVGTMKIATMALTFSTYFCMLFPSVPGWLAAVSCTLIFTVISIYGLKLSSQVQNICVGVLLLALGCYLFMGWGATTVSIATVVSSTFQLAKMWAAMGIMHGSLMGANVLMYVADEVENPSKNVPVAFGVSTMVTAILYAGMAYVTVGVMPDFFKIDNLATVAGKFMSPGMLAFFISGGALLAVVTSINSAIMMFSRVNFAAARDGLLPAGLSRINRYGVPANSIWLNSIICCVAILSGMNLTDVVNITTIPGLLLNPIIFFAVFMLPKYYPNAYKASYLKIPHWLNCVIVVVSTALCFLLGGSVLFQMNPRNWIIMTCFYILVTIYTILRMNWLKKNRNINLFQNMKTAYAPWDEREKRAAEALAKDPHATII